MATSPPHPLANQTIILSGAGISALSFTIALHKLWPSKSASPPPKITLYERDPSANPAGRQGYSLSLRSDPPSHGLQTLQKLGLLDEILKCCLATVGSGEQKAQGESGGMIIWNASGSEILKLRTKQQKGMPVASARIRREALKSTLVNAVNELPGVEIIWGVAVTGVARSTSSSTKGDGKIGVELSDGEKDECDILLDCSGSSSAIRRILRPKDELSFAGPVSIVGTAPLSASPTATRDDDFGMLVSGKNAALFVAPMDSNTLVWSMSWNEASPCTPRKAPLTNAEIEDVLAEAKDVGGPIFGERFVELVEKTKRDEGVMKMNAMDKSPFAHKGEYVTFPNSSLKDGTVAKVAFLGDANHAVSPFAGNGANLALSDGWDMAESLVECKNWEEAVRRYDERAVTRAKTVIGMSRFTMRVAHSNGLWYWVWMIVLRVVRFIFYK